MLGRLGWAGLVNAGLAWPGQAKPLGSSSEPPQRGFWEAPWGELPGQFCRSDVPIFVIVDNFDDRVCQFS